MKKILISIIFSLAWVIPGFAQEETITITTYYPAPYGVYNVLETETLQFSSRQNGLISFNYPDTNYDRRLRITAGRRDTFDNDQGASIDLHGNDASTVPGGLHLVAGRDGEIVFFTSDYPDDLNAERRMWITPEGRVLGNICMRRLYTRTSGSRGCPPGSQLAGVVYNATFPDTGYYLCCPFCNDFNYDNECD